MPTLVAISLFLFSAMKIKELPPDWGFQLPSDDKSMAVFLTLLILGVRLTTFGSYR